MMWCGLCLLLELCRTFVTVVFQVSPKAVPTEAASERRGEAPTEAQLHSARLTEEADLTKAINIYISSTPTSKEPMQPHHPGYHRFY